MAPSFTVWLSLFSLWAVPSALSQAWEPCASATSCSLPPGLVQLPGGAVLSNDLVGDPSGTILAVPAPPQLPARLADSSVVWMRNLTLRLASGLETDGPFQSILGMLLEQGLLLSSFDASLGLSGVTLLVSCGQLSLVQALACAPSKLNTAEVCDCIPSYALCGRQSIAQDPCLHGPTDMFSLQCTIRTACLK